MVATATSSSWRAPCGSYIHAGFAAQRGFAAADGFDPISGKRRWAEDTNAPNGPPELGQYLMCVEQCSVAEAPRRRLKRNPVSCAFKLRCALAPLDETVQTAFLDCQKQLGVDPPRRLRESCECLRGADLTSMQC
ncbi:hypothetical protein QR680_017442 [Steinernema hermaphroditum]|uniref:Uncharacterized protein n=1 Tax=Steinernema hermaphroditum TaxID=289476 RepID=A0AA39HGZ2_9BILA|nr:hypothetical protein QR680_017442 [Steinernema hermaphroditum]